MPLLEFRDRDSDTVHVCQGNLRESAQVPEDQLPTYVKGQHLRGVDATIVERVSAEMVCS